ncbi:MAG: hypothetical protein R3321_09825 [Nitrososphaeraceae archaeon]|nr:hypothetical protein [Nitrososphaeraceae archaeon]
MNIIHHVSIRKITSNYADFALLRHSLARQFTPNPAGKDKWRNRQESPFEPLSPGNISRVQTILSCKHFLTPCQILINF